MERNTKDFYQLNEFTFLVSIKKLEEKENRSLRKLALITNKKFAILGLGDYALKLMADGKLNLTIGKNKNLEIEQMKIKNFRNNVVISFFGIVIVFLLIF